MFFITATTHCRIAWGVVFFSKLHLDAIHVPGKPICILFIHCNGWNFFKSPCESLVQFLICFSTSVMLALVPRFYGEGHKRLLKFYLGFFHWCITLAILTTLQACPDLSLVPSGLDSRSLPARVLNARTGFFFGIRAKTVESGSAFLLDLIYLRFRKLQRDIGPNCDCAAHHDNVIIYLKIIIIVVGSSFPPWQSAAFEPVDLRMSLCHC